MVSFLQTRIISNCCYSTLLHRWLTRFSGMIGFLRCFSFPWTRFLSDFLIAAAPDSFLNAWLQIPFQLLLLLFALQMRTVTVVHWSDWCFELLFLADATSGIGSAFVTATSVCYKELRLATWHASLGLFGCGGSSVKGLATSNKSLPWLWGTFSPLGELATCFKRHGAHK